MTPIEIFFSGRRASIWGFWSRYQGHRAEEQLKWPLENVPWEASSLGPELYASVEEHQDFAKEKFEEDVSEGLMAKMSLRDFVEKYGEDRAIAAMA